VDAHEHGQGGESGPGYSGAENGASVDGRTASAVLHVGGLHCASQKAVVERVLANRLGVLSVEANPVAQTATVEYDPQATTVEGAPPVGQAVRLPLRRPLCARARLRPAGRGG